MPEHFLILLFAALGLLAIAAISFASKQGSLGKKNKIIALVDSAVL